MLFIPTTARYSGRRSALPRYARAEEPHGKPFTLRLPSLLDDPIHVFELSWGCCAHHPLLQLTCFRAAAAGALVMISGQPVSKFCPITTARNIALPIWLIGLRLGAVVVTARGDVALVIMRCRLISFNPLAELAAPCTPLERLGWQSI